MVENSRRSVIIAMMTTDPDTNYAVSVFQHLIQDKFPQCILLNHPILFFLITNYLDTGTEKEVLCTECIQQCFRTCTITTDSIGTIHDGATVSYNFLLVVLFYVVLMYFKACSKFLHQLPIKPTFLKQPKQCKTHQQSRHHIFLNYRVRTEGKRTPSSSVCLNRVFE